MLGFSVQSHPGKTADELAAAGRFPHRKISVATMAQVRGLGYEVVPTSGGGYHATVCVPRDWTEQAADVLAAQFEVRSNPYPRTST